MGEPILNWIFNRNKKKRPVDDVVYDEQPSRKSRIVDEVKNTAANIALGVTIAGLYAVNRDKNKEDVWAKFDRENREREDYNKRHGL
jgi:hypothetical protein